MAQLIHIKRSLNTADPTSLANGELAYTANGDVLFIGSNGSYYAIAGRRYPGTLTANQAVTVNSSSLIDTIKDGNTSQNVVITTSGIQINNTAAGGNTITIPAPTTSEKGDGNRYLKADGTWSTVTGATANPAGQNTYVQYNDSAAMGGAADFTYAEDTKLLTVNGAVSLEPEHPIFSLTKPISKFNLTRRHGLCCRKERCVFLTRFPTLRLLFLQKQNDRVHTSFMLTAHGHLFLRQSVVQIPKFSSMMVARLLTELPDLHSPKF